MHTPNTLALTLALTLSACACSKKTPKPKHTEPWLAHPSASAGVPDASIASVAFRLAAGSKLEFELKTKKARWQGQVPSLHGSLELSPANLAATRAHVEADLRTLSLDGDASDASDTARRALGLTADAGPGGAASAVFELGSLDDLASPSLLEARTHGEPSGVRRVRATAVGELSLHGFRVSERVPVDAEVTLSPGGDPISLVIRSRTPFVVSLVTHQIAPRGVDPAPREARVSFELHLEK